MMVWKTLLRPDGVCSTLVYIHVYIMDQYINENPCFGEWEILLYKLGFSHSKVFYMATLTLEREWEFPLYIVGVTTFCIGDHSQSSDWENFPQRLEVGEGVT